MFRALLLLVLALVLMPFALASNLLYSIELDTSGDNIELTEVRIISGEMPLQLVEYVERYEAKAVSFKGEELASVDFTISNYPTHSPGPIEIPEISIIMPYYPNARAVKLLDPEGEELLEVDVSQFSACNEDSICDYNENEKACPTDCTEGEVVEREATLEVAMEEIAEEEQEVPSPVQQYWPYLLALVIAVIIAAAIIIKAKKK